MLELLNNRPIDETAPKVFACAKNGWARFPYFLDFYRDLGVGTFFIVDNNSNDASVDYLKEQPDVVLYWTDESYQEANAGRRWTDEMMRRHAGESWCLTLDIDEFLLYPFHERLKLPVLCKYLDEGGYKGLFALMLDHYPEGRLADAHYHAGESVFDIAPCHDAVNRYVVHDETYFPYVNIRGGVRQRLFFSPNKPTSGPPQKKIPLVKHHEGFSYQYSTHGTTPLPLADITGALAHFKFFGDTEEYVKGELTGKDRRNPKDYVRYQKGLARNERFYCAQSSRSRTDSVDLVNEGFMAISPHYLKFVEWYAHREAEADIRLEELVERLDEFRHVPLDQLMRSWHLLVSLQRREVDTRKELEAYQDAWNYVEASRKHYSLALTLPLRKRLRKHRFISSRMLPEFMDRDFTLKEQIRFTYDSVLWDLTAVVRLVGRFLSMVRTRWKK